MKVKSLSCVRLLATPWTAAYQAPPSMGFSRQEYWSGVSLPSLIARPYCESTWDAKYCFGHFGKIKPATTYPLATIMISTYMQNAFAFSLRFPDLTHGISSKSGISTFKSGQRVNRTPWAQFLAYRSLSVVPFKTCGVKKWERNQLLTQATHHGDIQIG